MKLFLKYTAVAVGGLLAVTGLAARAGAELVSIPRTTAFEADQANNLTYSNVTGKTQADFSGPPFTQQSSPILQLGFERNLGSIENSNPPQGSVGGGGQAVLFYIPLPKLASGQGIDSAHFNVSLLHDGFDPNNFLVSPRFSADLYGVGFVRDPGVMTHPNNASGSFFYANQAIDTGPAVGTGQPVQLLQRNFFTLLDPTFPGQPGNNLDFHFPDVGYVDAANGYTGRVFQDGSSLATSVTPPRVNHFVKGTTGPLGTQNRDFDGSGDANLVTYVRSLYANPNFINDGQSYLALRLNPDYSADVTTPGWIAQGRPDIDAANGTTRYILPSNTTNLATGEYAGANPGTLKVNITTDPNFHIWKTDSDDSWSTDANWINGQANAAEQTASFLGATSAPRTVTVDSSKTVGSLIFDNVNGYTLKGPGTINLDNDGHETINVISGSHTISAPLSMASGGLLRKLGPGTLTISGPQTYGPATLLALTAGVTNLNSDGGPNLILAADAATNLGSSQHLAALSIGAGATVKMTPGSNKLVVTPSLNIAGGNVPTGKLDIADNGLVINYSGATPLATVRQQIIAGYGPGKDWTGPTGIGSSLGNSNGLAVGIAEASDFGLITFGGQAVDNTSLVVRLTRYGDANLDGITDSSDLGRLLQNYNKSGGWAKGDGNYDGFVDSIDLGLLLNNFNKTVPVLNGLQSSLSAAVPEPGSIILFGLGSIGLIALSRKRRRDCCR